MEKLNSQQIEEILKDVRSSYRLLALYQRRLKDVVKYIANSYNANFESGWAKFSRPASHGNRVNIDKWSWDWLSLYLYEFNLGVRKIGENSYHLKIVHQADTGFYDVSVDKKISKLNIEQFGDVDCASTRLFFVLSKNENGCPIQHVLKNHLSIQTDSEIVQGNWLAVPYHFERFTNQESTDTVIRDFNLICAKIFQVTLTSNEY